MKITPEGAVKVLDFGLAKPTRSDLSEQEIADSHALTLEGTREGIVLGTAAYMSPEQAHGQVVDKRTGVWSFGLVLFEMLAAKGMYAGKSLTDTIAAVIHQDPTLEALPKDTPRKIRALLERCLRKDPRMRLRDMGDVRIAVQECLTGAAGTTEEVLFSPPPGLPSRRLAPWAAVPLLALGAWLVKVDPPLPDKPVSRFEIPLGKGELLMHDYRHGVAFSEGSASGLRLV